MRKISSHKGSSIWQQHSGNDKACMSPSYVMNISSFLHQHRKDFKLLSVTEYRFFAQKADDPIFQGFKSFYHRQCFENFSYWQDQLIEKYEKFQDEKESLEEKKKVFGE